MVIFRECNMVDIINVYLNLLTCFVSVSIPALVDLTFEEPRVLQARTNEIKILFGQMPLLHPENRPINLQVCNGAQMHLGTMPVI